MTPLICKLIGHKWLWKTTRDERRGDDLVKVTQWHPLSNCVRCGAPAPKFRDHARTTHKDEG